MAEHQPTPYIMHHDLLSDVDAIGLHQIAVTTQSLQHLTAELSQRLSPLPSGVLVMKWQDATGVKTDFLPIYRAGGYITAADSKGNLFPLRQSEQDQSNFDGQQSRLYYVDWVSQKGSLLVPNFSLTDTNSSYSVLEGKHIPEQLHYTGMMDKVEWWQRPENYRPTLNALVGHKYIPLPETRYACAMSACVTREDLEWIRKKSPSAYNEITSPDKNRKSFFEARFFDFECMANVVNNEITNPSEIVKWALKDNAKKRTEALKNSLRNIKGLGEALATIHPSESKFINGNSSPKDELFKRIREKIVRR